MIILKIVGICLFTTLVISALILLVLGFRTQHDPRQKIFLTGTIPAILPDGLYKGSTSFPQPLWKGKKFNSANNSGTNILSVAGKEAELFPFESSVGVGNVDPSIQTLKIDYYVRQNPVPAWLIVDEVVETSPKHFLGKLELKVFPGKVVPITYFELDQNE